MPTIDPKKTQVVMIGVSRYSNDGFRPLPGVCRGLLRLGQVLEGNPGIPSDNIEYVLEPSTPSQVIDRIAERTKQAVDTLIVYYGGHGRTHNGRLLLTTTASNPNVNAANDITDTQLFNALFGEGTTPEVKRFVILDCCFSGKAIDDPLAVRQNPKPWKNTVLLCAAHAEKEALATPQTTYLTQWLVEALTCGIEGKRDSLTIHDLYEHVKTRAEACGAAPPTGHNHAPADLGRWIVTGKPWPTSDIVPPERIEVPVPCPGPRPWLGWVVAGFLGLVVLMLVVFMLLPKRQEGDKPPDRLETIQRVTSELTKVTRGTYPICSLNGDGTFNVYLEDLGGKDEIGLTDTQIDSLIALKLPVRRLTLSSVNHASPDKLADLIRSYGSGLKQISIISATSKIPAAPKPLIAAALAHNRDQLYLVDTNWEGDIQLQQTVKITSLTISLAGFTQSNLGHIIPKLDLTYCALIGSKPDEAVVQALGQQTGLKTLVVSTFVDGCLDKMASGSLENVVLFDPGLACMTEERRKEAENSPALGKQKGTLVVNGCHKLKKVRTKPPPTHRGMEAVHDATFEAWLNDTLPP